jgi:hypothetical protein
VRGTPRPHRKLRARTSHLARDAEGRDHAAMRFLFLLVALTCAGLSVAFFGPVISLPLLASTGLVAFAAVLWILGWRRRPPVAWIVVDGSNVMYWEAETPSLDTVRHVLRAVESEGLVPVVWFDANVGYLISGTYLGPETLARKLGLRQGQVLVAPKGTPADPLLLEEAARLGARVVTNDRFRDWAADHPIVLEPGALVRGRVRDGLPTLAFDRGQSRAT